MAAAPLIEDSSGAEFLRDVLTGLSATPRALPGKYLWDAKGSKLFDRICQTADYYPTRREMALLPQVAAEVASQVGPGATVVEFGSPLCGHCRMAQPLIATAMQDHPQVRHLKIEDGSGRRLGRSFKVKLWPTLVFMKAGKEVARLVRPLDAGSISEALGQIDPVAAGAG